MTVTLRAWRPDDLDALAPLLDDPQIRRITGARDATAWLAVQQAPGRHAFAVLRDDDLVGNVVLKLPDAEVGYWTAAHVRGQGLASQALRQLTAWAFAAFDLPSLALLHQVDNVASCAVARHGGYVFDRELPPGGGYPLPGHRHVRHRAG
jgi:RimJ/RimL family protein N-acetyltransferase